MEPSVMAQYLMSLEVAGQAQLGSLVRVLAGLLPAAKGKSRQAAVSARLRWIRIIRRCWQTAHYSEDLESLGKKEIAAASVQWA
jgi:hypothetical protein